jgi:hypothetical protein
MLCINSAAGRQPVSLRQEKEMRTQIDELHYCAEGAYAMDGDCVYPDQTNWTSYGICSPVCPAYRSKWETPAQYHKRTGEKLRDDAPVYSWHYEETISGNPSGYWELKEYVDIPVDCTIFTLDCIVATADWGKPPDDWRPEE